MYSKPDHHHHLQHTYDHIGDRGHKKLLIVVIKNKNEKQKTEMKLKETSKPRRKQTREFNYRDS